MKMKKMYFKKFMSVFMACLMLLSCWVWIAPEHAHAAAGNYYVKITWNVSDTKSFSNNFTGTEAETGARAGFILYYKDTNGTATSEKKVYWDVGNGGEAGGTYVSASSDATTSSAGSKTTTATITGFPTAFFAMIDSDAFWDGCVYDVTQIEVGASSTSTLTTIWKGTGHLDTTTNNYSYKITSDGDGTSTPTNSNNSYGYISTDSAYTSSWVYPYADTITWSDTPEAMTCPKTGTASQSVSVSAKDQYGVQMFDPTWSVKGNNKSTGISVSPTTSSGSTTISVTSSANIAGTTNSQTGTVTAKWDGVGTDITSDKTFTINDATYNATFTGHRNADATVQSNYTTTAKYGVTPTAPTAYNYSEGDYDYTFTGWSPTVSGITADTTYTATYSDGAFVGADYTAVNEAIAAADAIKAQYGTDYEFKYTHASRTALDAAIDAVVTGLGRTQQSVVDGYAKAINDAIAALAPNIFDVIFLDKDGAILLYEKAVEYKESVIAPADPEMYFDGTNHYTFDGWDTSEYQSVIDDLVINPVYAAEGHQWTTETVPSTCVQAGATKYTCTVCGYSYVSDETSLGDHVWETEYTVDLEPTCTVAGSKSIHCSLCDATKDTTEIPAAGHLWGSQSVAVSATCTSIGLSTRVCDDCGVCEHTIIEALTHDYVETVVAPTCTTKGYTEYVCQRTDCGHSYRDSFTDVAAHSFGEWETVINAACEVAGLNKRTCENCGFIELESITALEHIIPTEWTVVVNPTCIGTGYQTKTCTLCDVIMDEEEIPALNHDYTTTKETQATCTVAGEKVETCSRCGDTNTTVIQPLGHSYNEGVHSDASCTNGGFTTFTCGTCGHSYITLDDGATADGHNFEGGTETVITPATCTTDGEKTVQCVNDGCEYKINVVIPKTGHNHVAGTEVTATCTASGYIPYTCSCGDTYNVYNENDPAKGHEFNVLVSEEDATCIADGEEVYKCSRCDETQTTVLPKLGHNYELQSSVEADCTTAATEEYKCSVCADTYTKYIAPANSHSWGNWTKIQDATADKFGIEKRTCTVCQAEELRTTAPIGDHVFSEEITLEPGCETEGTKVYTCTEHENCSANYEETLPVTGHKAKLNYEAPTCTQAGNTQIVCETCNKELSDAQAIPAAGHTYGEGTQTTAPTCTEDGVMTYTCTVCGASRTEVISKTGHSLTSTYNAPSCLAVGSIVTNCANCSYTTSQEIPAAGHKLTVTVNNATCIEKGSVVETCTVCGDTKTTTLDPLGHSFTVDVEGTTTDATCTENGEKTVKCSRCDETTTVVLPKLGHDWPDDWTESKEATCTEDGEKTKECANCNETITAVIPHTGHTWGDWEVTKEATNTEDGEMTRTCNNGTCTETVVIPKGGHVWDNGTVTKPATCEETGTMVYKCTSHDDCGVTLEVTLAVIAHTITTEKQDATCTLDGYIKIYCSVCKKEFSNETTQKIAHNYVAGTAQEPTCTTSGYTPYTCSCGASYNAYDSSKPATGHKYVEGASTATCTAEGVMTLNCENCENSTTVDVPALGHDYVKDETASTTASCAAAATETYKCSHDNCDASYTVSVGQKATEHTWGNWEVKQSATATSIGYRTRTCTVCGQLDFEIIPATGAHSFTTETARTDASCTQDGSVTYACATHTDCGLTSTVTLPRTGHTEVLEYTEATCTTAGSTKMVCAVETCKEVLNSEEIPALGHAWSEDEIIHANCSADGKIIYKCARCSATQETIIRKNYISHDYITTITSATCTKEGSIVVKCARCTSNPVNEVIAKLEHTWGEGEVTDATCETDGKEVYKCQKCEATNEVTLPKTGHSWGEWQVTTPSTNTEEGEMTRTCASGCTETVTIPAGAHNLVVSTQTDASCTQEGSVTYDCDVHTGDADCGITVTVTLDKIQHKLKTESKDATCDTDGAVVTKCENCDTATVTTVIPKTGHAWNEGEVTTSASCTQEGLMTYTCAHNAEHQYTTVIAKTQHNYVAKTPVAATCTNSGYTPYKCETCESNYVIITAPAKGHDFAEGASTATCVEGGKMTLTCSCGATMEADVPALGHDYQLVSTTKATCAAAATETYDCSRCEAEYTVSVGSKTDEHDFAEWVTVEQASYTSIGYKTQECKICGKLEVETIPATGDHVLVESSRQDATCEADGWINYECSAHTDCGVTDRVEIPATGHTEELSYTAATCEAAGSAKIVCTVEGCGATIEEETIPALGHVWDNEKITLSTCSENGEVEFTCTRANCGETHIVELPVNEDAHKLTTTTNPASCTKEGSVVTSCNLCGETLAETTIPMIPHTWGAWTVTKAATNTADGEMTRYCNNGCTETAVIPAGGHTFASTPSSVDPATCTAEGTATYNCTAHASCGVTITVTLDKIQHTLKTNIVDAKCTQEGSVKTYCEACNEVFSNVTIGKLAHEFEAIDTVDPSCTHSGYTTYKCKNCDESYNEIGADATGHTYVEVEGSSTADCTTAGTMTLKCDCGETMTVNVPALGHDYQLESATVATCAAAATETYKCSSCDESYTISIGSKTENHVWGDWTVVENATASSLGYETRECSVCGKLEVQKIPATGEHNFTILIEAESKAPTCEQAGYETYRCSAHENCTETSKINIPAAGHTEKHSYTSATCETSGISAMVCEVCGKTLESEEIPALGHAWGAGTVTKQSTCSTEGEISYSCSREGCSETKTEKLPTIGHTLSTVTTDATCEEDGSVVTTCSNCDYKETTVIAKKDHTWSETPVSSTDATCEAEGSATYDCINCDKQNTVTIPKLGHTYVAGLTVAPTCTQSGYTVYVCQNNASHAYNVYDATKPATGHTWGNWEVTTSATETTDGLKTRTCACGAKEEEVIPAMKHNMQQVEYVASTCTQEGKIVYKCAVDHEGVICSYTLTVTLSKIAHTLTTTVTKATCEEEGSVVTSCTKCSEVNETTILPATGHKYVGKVTAEPTCTENGVMTYTCQNDANHTYTEEIEATGHNYEAVVTSPTCIAQGYTVHTCSKCGDSYKDSYKDALGHAWNDGEITTEATYDNDGEKTYTCQICSETKTEIIPAKVDATAPSGKIKWDATIWDSFLNAITFGKFVNYDVELEIEAEDAESGVKSIEYYVSDLALTMEEIKEIADWAAYNAENKLNVSAVDATKIVVYAKITDNKGNVTYISTDGIVFDTTDPVLEISADKGNVETNEYCSRVTITISEENLKQAYLDGYYVPVNGDTYSTNEAGTHTFEVVDFAGNSAKITFTVNEGHTESDPVKENVEGSTDCTQGGSYDSVVYCSVCGEEISRTRVTVEVTGHSYESVITEPTCTEQGYTTHTCTVCGDSYIDAYVDATGHISDAVITEPTCTQGGYTTYTCTVCGNSYVDSYVAATGHNYGEWVTDEEATCLEDGRRHKICLNDESHIEYGIIKATGHEYVGTVTTEPTCTEDGEMTYTCENDAEHTYTEKIAATGHSVGAWITTIEATCTEDGEKTRECADCDYFETELILARDHVWGIWIVIEGDCESGFTRQRVCLLCEETETESFDPGSHTYPTDENGNIIYDDIVEPTCTQDGLYYYDCDVCGGGEVRITIPATGHDFSDWIVISEPTCFRTGSKYRVCANNCGTGCGLDVNSREIVIISATNHEGNWVAEPGMDATCTENGYTSYYVCVICGFESGKNTIAATGHTDGNSDDKCDMCQESTNIVDNCDCMCHNDNGLMRFFYSIAKFFWKLFGINQTCECGEVHY